MPRLMILVDRPRHVATAEAELWLREHVAAIGGEGIERIELCRLTSPGPRFSDTWAWMVELTCRDAEAARDAVGDGAGLELIADLRLLGMRPTVALIGEPS